MTTVKRIFVAALVTLAAVLLGATGAWLLVDDATLVSLLVKRLESASDTRISYQDGASISRTWTPELSISELIVDDAGGRYRVETRSLQLQLSLPGLLIGRLDVPRLLIGDTRIDILKGSAAEEPDKPLQLDLSALRLRPVLHEAQISELSILFEGDKFQLPATQVNELSLRVKPGKDIPELSAQLEVEGEKLSVDATLPNLHQALKRKQLPFSVTVKGAIADSSALGQVDFSQPEAVVQAELHSHFPDLNKIPDLSKNLELPGELTLRAQLSGPFEQLAAEELSADWTGPGSSSLKLDGRIANVVKLEGVELAVSGQLTDADWLTPVLPDTLGALDSAELAARISGDRSLVKFQDLSLKARSADELDLSLTGQLDLAQLLQTPEIENLDLKLAFTAPTTHAARVLIFDEIPEFGAISGTADIRSTHGDPTIEHIVIRTQDEKGVQVDLSGRIAEFPLSDAPNKGYGLDVTMKATQTSLMAERAGMELPLSGPLDLRYRIEGDTEALELNQIKLSAGDKHKTLIGAEGRIHFGDWDQSDPMQSMDLAVRMSGRDTGFLSAWVEQDFPALAYQLQARLHTVDGQHRVDDYKLVTPKGEPLDIRETGSVDKVTFLPAFSMEGIRLDTRARTDDVARLNTLFKLDETIPAIGPLDLRMLVSGSDTKLLISKLTLNAGQEDVLRVEARGRVGHISAANKWRLKDTDLDLKARSSSSQALAQAFGHRIAKLGPVVAQASIRDKGKTLGVESMRIVVGDADRPTLAATGSIGDLYTASKVRIEAKLYMDGHDFARLADNQELPELGALTGKLLISDSKGALGIDSLHIESAKQDVLTLKLDGRFDDFSKPETLELNAKATARDANLWWALFDLEWPGHGLVELDAQLTRADGGTLFKASAISGEEKIDMVLNADFQTSPPQIKGKITAQNFFLPDPAEKKRQQIAREREEKKKPKQKPPVFSREPMNLGWMKKADVDLSVDIQSFDRANSEALSGNFRAVLKSGHLSVKPATLVYPKGRADLDLQFDGTDTPKFGFSLSGENLDPWRGLNVYEPGSRKQFETKDAELNVNIALTSSGKSRHDMAASAQGEFYVTMKHGKISQSKLNLLFVDIVGWASDQAKRRYDDVNCAIADYSIRQGLVTTNAFFMDTDRITIAGEGTLDLGREQVDYTFIPRKKSRLILKAEPVHIKGPLNDPSIEAIPVKSAALTFGTLIFAPYVFAGMAVADFAHDKLGNGDGDSSICAKYEKDLKKSRDKETTKKQAEKKDRRWKNVLPLQDEED
ncbi:MAG: AsmA-like C-terminal region-containing protein [Pseudomonadota bacterium]|nr:AsmA-like C-terminal region-containing protein [Pseudomonadota bacterium]